MEQIAEASIPEELPTAPVTTRIQMIDKPKSDIGFDRFNFDEEVIL